MHTQYTFNFFHHTIDTMVGLSCNYDAALCKDYAMRAIYIISCVYIYIYAYDK